MDQKYKYFAIMVILAVFSFIFSSSFTKAAATLEIKTSPVGADVYYDYGPKAGTYIGTTPFFYDPTLEGGTTYMRFKKAGYVDAKFIVSSYMKKFPYIVIYLNPLITSSPTPTLFPSVSPTSTPSPSASPTVSPSPSASPTASPSVSPTPSITASSLPPISYPSSTSFASWPDLVSGTTGWILGITVSIILLLLIIGGLFYIFSAGNEQRMALAKRIIITALIGFFVIILSVSIIAELKKIL